MKKILVLLALIVLVMSTTAIAAVLTWTAPTTYTDTSAIAPADIARIVYTPYYGASATGPWTAGTTTGAGVLTTTLPDPSPGATRWYTVDATLDGMTSAKAAAKSKTVPFRIPAGPVLDVQ